MSLGRLFRPFLDKFNNLGSAIKHNGGIIGSFLSLQRTDELKWGQLVGEDEFGNQYFHNKYFAIGKSRWVKYSDRFGYDFEGSQVPAEWHNWLHYITDETPVTKPPVKKDWMSNHKVNTSGTDQQYVPYTTTKPKIQAWQPPMK